MTKSVRAKKRKKADFAKVKFKVGKTIKKAQNETKTDFKARKIIIKEQLGKKSDQDLLTKRKQNIKDLLSRLSHSSIYVRQDGVNGLLEIVKKYEVVTLEPNLPSVLQGLAPLLFDSDTLIRSSAIKFMEALILKVGSNIAPYFNIIATHLSCAMVHLNINVQGDSLKLMHVLIKHTPALIARHANTLLKNFVNLISRKASSTQTSSKLESGMVDFSRILHVNPSNSLTSPKWRLQLLQELSGFLEAILVEQKHVEEQVPYTIWETVVVGSVPPVVTADVLSSTTQEMWLLSDPEQLKKFSLSIIPLLFQIWAEVRPGGTQDYAGSNTLSEESVETLNCIVRIIRQLWHITQVCLHSHPTKCTWFMGALKASYMTKIMVGFPYYCHLGAVQNKKKKPKMVDKKMQPDGDYSLRHCDDLNVSLALFAMQMSSSEGLAENALNFFTKLLRDGNRDGQYNLGSVVNILSDLLQLIPEKQADSLLAAAQTCYTRLHPLKKDRALLLQILLAATDIDHPQLWKCGSNSVWVYQVVEDLASGSARDLLLHTAIILRLRNNTEIKQLLLARKDEIREKIESKGIQGMTPGEVNKKLHLLLKD